MEQKTPKKEKKGQSFANFLWGVAITMTFQIGITSGHTAYERNELFNDIESSYFNKTVFNVPLLLPITGGVVSLNINPAFSEQEKQELVKGITELDNLLDGVNYTISFEDKDIKKGINIKPFKLNQKQLENGIACATIKADHFKAEIKYPMTIKFDTKMMEEKGYSYDYIIKHELLHTLGLKDLTDSEFRKNIMYGTYKTYPVSLNSEQIKALNKVYDPYRTGVFGPTDCGPSVDYFWGNKTVSNAIVEDDDLLTF